MRAALSMCFRLSAPPSLFKQFLFDMPVFAHEGQQGIVLDLVLWYSRC